MTAYLIARIRVTDPVAYEEYKPLAAAAITAAGGRYVVRGGSVETLEGAADDCRVVVVAFPSMAAARAFHDGAAYRAAWTIRERAAESSVILVEGVS